MGSRYGELTSIIMAFLLVGAAGYDNGSGSKTVDLVHMVYLVLHVLRIARVSVG